MPVYPFGLGRGQVAQMKYSPNWNQPGVLPQAVTTIWRTELGTTLVFGINSTTGGSAYFRYLCAFQSATTPPREPSSSRVWTRTTRALSLWGEALSLRRGGNPPAPAFPWGNGKGSPKHFLFCGRRWSWNGRPLPGEAERLDALRFPSEEATSKGSFSVGITHPRRLQRSMGLRGGGRG
jgi:hypothetical protein